MQVGVSQGPSVQVGVSRGPSVQVGVSWGRSVQVEVPWGPSVQADVYHTHAAHIQHIHNKLSRGTRILEKKNYNHAFIMKPIWYCTFFNLSIRYLWCSCLGGKK